MRKIIFFLLLVLFSGVIPVNANITTYRDRFTGENEYSVLTKHYTYNQLLFTKKFEDGKPTYTLYVTYKIFVPEEQLRLPIEIKVDDLPIITIDEDQVRLFKINQFDLDNSLKKSKLIIPSHVIDLIQDGKSVKIRVLKGKAYSVMIALTEETVSEWQRIINTEK
ncbi:hypothetical protein [Sporomusa aerivorans]|uniref:hypothetical protein n=1 Tax=Sporomusa aerivorans TaxID=204936 RepID=UPI00352AD638